MEAEPGDDQRVEALNADIAVIAFQQGEGLFTEFAVARAVFQLDNQGLTALNVFQNLGKEGDLFIGAAETQLLQLGSGQLVHAGMHAADAVQRVVVEDHDLAVL